jgi:hypothetical protein
MVNTIWVAVTSLVGVVVGGTLSLLSQLVLERSAARRHVTTILEGRREERLTRLIAFIETAMEAERLATSLHEHHASGDEMIQRTETILDQLWVRLRAVQLLCPSEVSDAAHALAEQVHAMVRHGPGDQSVSASLRPFRKKLIDSAHIDLDRI